MDTVTAISERRLDAFPTQGTPAATKTLTVTATYLLSEDGRKASLLDGGDGKAVQHLSLQVPANRLHLVTVDAKGVARLKLRPRYQLDGDNGIARVDTAPTYDSPPDVEELFREAARNHQLERAYHSERQATKIKRREADHERRTIVAKAFLSEDWKTPTIGDSLRLINGRAFKPEDWKERGLPIVRIQNLNDSESSFNYWPGPVEERHRFQAGDLLFAWSGTTGTSFGARVWNGPAGVLNQHIFKVIPNQQKLTLRYALLVLRRVQDHIEKQAHGFKASFVHVKKTDLVGVQLPLPPTKAEQDAIADVLGDTDALIESLEQLVAKRRQIRQGAMQELLAGRKRLPGFTGEWAVKRLGEIGATFGGLSGKTKRDFGHGAARYITFMNIMTNVVIDCDAFESVDIKPMESQNRVAKGDLFFNGSS